jgi:hypothetical protein
LVIPHAWAGCSRVTHPFATGPRRTPFDLHVLSAPPAFVLSQDQTLHELNSSLEQTLLRLFGIRVVWFPYTGTWRTRCLHWIPKDPGCATGRTIQALPNTLIVKCFADRVRFFTARQSAGFTRSVASRRRCSGESFKLTTPACFVNPSVVVTFSTSFGACRRLTLSI